jgi:hypothetical protein
MLAGLALLFCPDTGFELGMQRLAEMMQEEEELSSRAAAIVSQVAAMPMEVQQQAAYLAAVGLTSVVQLPGWVLRQSTCNLY